MAGRFTWRAPHRCPTSLERSRTPILLANEVSPPRARFTLLHELGHHLLATHVTHLLDDIDDQCEADGLG
jgi:Zn-dependent peptidase ImmA (M78 family)